VRWVVRIAVGLWLVAALTAFAGAISFANGVSSRETELRQQLRRLERDHRQLQEEHRELQLWVADVLRPWLVRAVGEDPEGEPPPMPPPVVVPSPDPVPPSPTPAPTPIPTPTPEPTPSASPSFVCVPIIQVCL